MLKVFDSCRPLINKPPPLNRNYNRDTNMKALQRRGFDQSGIYIKVYRSQGRTQASGHLHLQVGAVPRLSQHNRTWG